METESERMAKEAKYTQHTDELFGLIAELCSLPTVSGHEYMSADKIRKLSQSYADGFFDYGEITPSGSVLLWHHSKHDNAKTLLLDAHLDTVGFAVSEILDGGFVRLENVGGIDTAVLKGCEIEIYGKEKLRAFFSSVPPHLSKLKNSDEAEKVSDTFADTGLSTEECKRLIAIGTPCGYVPKTLRLMGNRISSVSLDDKICIASVLSAARLLSEEQIENINVCVQLSTGEERGAKGAGATHFAVKDAAECIVLDVNFAKEAKSTPGSYIEMEKGAGLSLSACTSRELTDRIYSVAMKKGIPCQRIVELCDTGTNAQVIARVGTGIKCAVLSIPVKYMHTSVETASLDDVVYCAQVLCEYIKHSDKNGISIPVYNYKEGGHGKNA